MNTDLNASLQVAERKGFKQTKLLEMDTREKSAISLEGILIKNYKVKNTH